jgi:quaternary ammonium compound-resistance protein SugE
MAWIYLFIASLFEIAWTFCVKFMDVKGLRAIQWRLFFSHGVNWAILAPFAGYIVFGVGNIAFFSMAMKDIPASTALAVWMGVTLVGVKLMEMSFFRQAYDFSQFFYMALILIGIVGLKRGM